MTKQQSPSILAAAFLAISNELTDIQERVARDGEVETFDAMMFAKRRVFNGLCYSIERTLDSSHEQLVKAAYRLRRTVKHYEDAPSQQPDGTEISNNQLQRDTEWVERIQLQVEALTRMLDEAKAAHAAHCDEEYVSPKLRAKHDAEVATKRPANKETAGAYALLDSILKKSA